MKIKPWIDTKDQMCSLGRHSWSVPRLFELSKGLEVFKIPLDGLNISNTYEKLNIREMVMHMNAVNNADLNYPIILDEDGELMDGMHRIMKAILLGKKKIKAVRFDVNPDPCRIKED